MTTSYTYDTASRRVSESSTGSGLNKSTTYTYNLAGMLTGMTNTSFGSAISSYSYAYNSDGTQRSKTENGTTTTYTYDTAGRLLSESGTSNITYTYNARGNRTAMTKGSVTITYTSNKANQLLTETSQGVTKNYTYDNAGNLTTVTSGISTLKTYTYDAWRRQTGYSEPQELITASYTYGPDNLRRSKTAGANTTSYVWSGGNMVYEATSSGGTVYRYGATIFASDDGTATYTYLLNGHGDVVQMPVGTTVVKSYKYDAFGNEIGINSADTNPFRYCAQYYDKESGTIYLRARYYAPGEGRFTQQDTHWHPGNRIYGDNPRRINERKTQEGLSLCTYLPDIHAITQSGNLYGYCENSPIIYVDFNGEIFMLVTAAIGAVISGVGGAIYSQVKYGEVRWQNVAASAAIGGAVGLTGGAATAYVVTGSAVASTGTVVSGLGIAGITATGGTGMAATALANELSRKAEPIFRSFTQGNFRYNLQQLTGDIGSGLQAHHVLPQKFANYFAQAGLNIHDPIYGSWVNSTECCIQQ